MFDMLIGSATAGFGASFGRDIYKAAKKNPLMLAVIGALLLVFGWRNAFMGYARGTTYFVFVTVIGSALMIIIGGVCLGAIAFHFGMAFSNESATVATAATIGALGLFSAIGIIWGMSARAARIQTMHINALNYVFLEENGFTESEFESDQIVDAEGHTLKVIEETPEKIVFSVVGRRGLRSAIRIEGGQMISYTGVQKAA